MNNRCNDGKGVSPDDGHRFHQDISTNIFELLRTYVVRHRNGKVYYAPFDVYLDQINVHQPDILFVSNKNRIQTDGGAEGAPDFIVEILSPKTAHLDTKSKRRVYARSGVKELWLVDPEQKLVSIYFLQQDREKPAATYGETDTFTSPHFPGLKFKGAKIFQR